MSFCDLLEVVDKYVYTCIVLCSQAPLLCLSYSKQLLLATALLCNIRFPDPCDFWGSLLLPSSASAFVITKLRTRRVSSTVALIDVKAAAT